MRKPYAKTVLLVLIGYGAYKNGCESSGSKYFEFRDLHKDLYLRTGSNCGDDRLEIEDSRNNEELFETVKSLLEEYKLPYKVEVLHGVQQFNQDWITRKEN